MTNLNDRASQAASRKREVKLAQLMLEDEIDMRECVNDLQTRLGMNEGTARMIAAAFRAQEFPNIAREEGLDDAAISKLMRTAQLGMGAPMTSDFAKDKPKHNALDDDPLADSPEDDFDPEMDQDSDLGEHGDIASHEDAEEGNDMNMEGFPGSEGDSSLDPTMDFKKEKKAPAPLHDSPDMGGDEMGMGGDDDLGEANDNGMATLKIEVPADQVDEVKALLDQLLGGGDEFSNESGADDHGLGDDLGNDDMGAGDDLGSGDDKPFGGSKGDKSNPFGGKQGKQGKPFGAKSDMDDKMGSFGPDDAEDSNEAAPQKLASRKVQPMSTEQKVLAQRKAEREALLARMAGTRTASEEGKPKDIGLGKDTSHNGKAFQFADSAQYKPEDEFPTMTLEGSEGNSLRDQNPTYAKQDIPTKNPEHLGLKSGLNAVTKEGSESGDLQYEIKFDMLDNVPSGEPDRSGDFDVPTQMGAVPRKTTVASVDDPEEELFQLLVKAGVKENDILKMTFAQGVTFYKKIVAAQIDRRLAIAETVNSVDSNEATQASKMVDDKDEEKGDGPRLNIQPNGDGFSPSGKSEDKDEKSIKEAEVYKARLKTAFSVSSKLALAGVIQPNEVDAHAELWLNDGMSVKSMLATGAQFLRLAQSATERVASDQAAKSVRTASNSGIANVPAFNTNNAPQDLQTALRGIFSSPKFDE